MARCAWDVGSLANRIGSRQQVSDEIGAQIAQQTQIVALISSLMHMLP